MMKRSLLSAILLCSVVVASFAQVIVRGRVLEEHAKKPISFANIGILNSDIGTISNADGSFSISVPPQHAKDTLIFSALGFKTRRVPLSFAYSHVKFDVLLSESITQLETFTVSAKKEKNKTYWLGNKYYRGGNIYADSIAAGSAMALLIENKYPAYHADLTFPVFVDKALLRISANTFDEFKVRIRILEYDSLTKLPGRDLFNESVVVASRIKSGWLEFDLSPFRFQIDKPLFFLVFEWILDDRARKSLLEVYKDYQRQHPDKVVLDTMIVRGEKVPYNSWRDLTAGTYFGVSPIQFSLDNYQSYYRNNSFGEWKRASAILTARLLVSDQPANNLPSVYPKALSAGMANKDSCAEPTPVCETQKLCESFFDEGMVNGLQISVSVKGKTMISRGFGFADKAEKLPVTTQTRFRVGSISKALTSAALIKLIAEKKLDLDAPVQNYVSTFPQKKFTVTTRQLAGHLGGVRHYAEGELIQTKHYRNSTESISVFKDDSLLFAPGTQYAYSSYGWNLIGAVIEGASQQRYLDYMVKNIWAPLGMNLTYGDIADSAMVNRGKFYYATGEQAANDDLSYKYPSGGLLSTTEDLVRFGNELLHGRYFDQELKKELFQSQHTADGKSTYYGLGWNIVKDKNGHRVWYHAGDLPESSGYLLIYPDDDMVIAFLANSGEGLAFNIQEIGELFYRN